MAQKTSEKLDIGKQLRSSLFKSLLIPVVLLLFFLAAPAWLNAKLHREIDQVVENSQRLSPAEKTDRLARLDELNFETVCFNCPPGEEKLHDTLANNGIVGNFERLRWGLWLSVALVACLAVALLAIHSLNQKAKKSIEELTRCYRLSWRIAITAALIKVLLLIPLLTYGIFEFSVLLTDHYLLKLLIIFIIGGLIAIWQCCSILLKKIPLEFKERLSREVTPEEAPELWRIVRFAAGKLNTNPPDRILVGMQLNFFVTELAVVHDQGRVEGKTLFLSYPLLKQLSEDEVLAIIGHELGHFIGEDTKLTREFYPIRLKVRATALAIARAGWIGWPSIQLLNFFTWAFSETERATSRQRELLADATAARLTSATTMAHALIRFQVVVEVFKRGLREAIQKQSPNPFELPLQMLVQEQLGTEPEFWTKLFKKKLPHPLDTHPTLQVRLESLQQTSSISEAQTIAFQKIDTAFEKWFAQREDLFLAMRQKSETLLGQMQQRTAVAQADYKTEAGRQLLDKSFPEQSWATRSSPLWVILSLFLVIGLVLVGLACFIQQLEATLIILSLVGIFAYRVFTMFKRHFKGRLTLTAEGLRYSGWRRPLLFADVGQITARRSKQNYTLNIRLKVRQPSYWKLSPLYPNNVRLSLTYIQGKQAVVAQTIFDYYKRQLRFNSSDNESKPLA